MAIEAYPLCWPQGYPREQNPKASRFKITIGAARDEVKDEIRRIHGKLPVISTNIPLKDNGDLYARYDRIEDTGVAVYFEYKGNQVCLCCDTYKGVHENLKAIARTINSLRTIDRDGVSDFLSRAFTGFKALPEGGAAETETCWQILGIQPTKDKAEITKAYRALSFEHHPDQGGNVNNFVKINNAYTTALQSL